MFPVTSILIYRDPIITVLSIVMALMVLLKHSGNIVRLCKGCESKFYFKREGKKRPVEKSAEAPARTTEEEKSGETEA